MPIIEDIYTEGAHIMVWKDMEEMSFFIEQTNLSRDELKRLEKYSVERRKKDLLIARFLLQKDYPNAEVVYHNSGKPYLKGQEAQISISHSKDIIAVILHKEKMAGIDIEYITPRVERVKNRFLSSFELATANTTQLLTIYWSAKETLFKLDNKQGLEFNKEIVLSPKNENSLIGKVRNGKGITVNCIKTMEWVMTYALIESEG